MKWDEESTKISKGLKKFEYDNAQADFRIFLGVVIGICAGIIIWKYSNLWAGLIVGIAIPMGFAIQAANKYYKT